MKSTTCEYTYIHNLHHSATGPLQQGDLTVHCNSPTEKSPQLPVHTHTQQPSTTRLLPRLPHAIPHMSIFTRPRRRRSAPIGPNSIPSKILRKFILNFFLSCSQTNGWTDRPRRLHNRFGRDNEIRQEINKFICQET